MPRLIVIFALLVNVLAMALNWSDVTHTWVVLNTLCAGVLSGILIAGDFN